jgi:hypothetical protein
MAPGYEFVWYNCRSLRAAARRTSAVTPGGETESGEAERIQPDLGDRAMPGEPHREVELGDVVAHHLAHAVGTGGREPVRVRTPDAHRGRAEREGDEGSASRVATAPSTWRPPWFETTTPSTP